MEKTKITHELRNDLLKRKEVQIVIRSEKNPGLSAAKEFAVKKFNAENDCVAVKFLRNNFGRKDFLAEIFIYDNAQDMMRIEPKQKKKKGVGK
jgi:ribosomal protein S24E